MLVYYFVPFIVSNRYLLFWVSNGHNSVTVQNGAHVCMNVFDHKDLENHLLQLCPKVVKHPVYIIYILHLPEYKMTFLGRYLYTTRSHFSANITRFRIFQITDLMEILVPWMISGFRREVVKNCVLLSCYSASNGDSLPTFRTSCRSHTDRLYRKVGKESQLLVASVLGWLSCIRVNAVGAKEPEDLL